MKIRTIAELGLAALLIAAAVFAGRQWQQRKGLSRRLASANAAAAAYGVRYDSLAHVYRAYAQQHQGDAEILDSLRKTNGALADEIEAAHGKILSLQRQRTEFRVALDSARSQTRAEADTAITFTLKDRSEWGHGSFFQVEGPVRVDLLSGSASYNLVATGAFGETVVLDQRGDALAVSVRFDHPGFEVSELHVENNIERPLVGGSGGLFAGLAHQLTSGSAWTNRLIGAAAMWLLLNR